MLKDYSCFHIQDPLWNNPVKYYRDPAWLTRKLLLLLWLDHHPQSFLWIALEIEIPHNLSHLSNLTSSQSQPCSRGNEVIEIRIILNKFWQDSQNKRDHVTLSSPNLAACGPRVNFVWMLKGLWKHKVTEVQLCPDTHTSWQRWWQVADLWERGKIMSLWWHTEHTWASVLGLTRMRAPKLINFLWDQESQQGYSSQKQLLKGQFTLHSLHIRPHSFFLF